MSVCCVNMLWAISIKTSVATNIPGYMAFVRCYKDNRSLEREKSKKKKNQLPRQEGKEEKKIAFQRVIFTIKRTQCRQAEGNFICIL